MSSVVLGRVHSKMGRINQRKAFSVAPSERWGCGGDSRYCRKGFRMTRLRTRFSLEQPACPRKLRTVPVRLAKNRLFARSFQTSRSVSYFCSIHAAMEHIVAFRTTPDAQPSTNHNVPVQYSTRAEGYIGDERRSYICGILRQ